MFVKLPTNAGVYLDDTPLTSEGFYIDADKIRFVRGVPQTFNGWELATNTKLTGLCRGIHTWVDSNTYKWVGMGTHTNLYAMTDSVVYDITPAGLAVGLANATFSVGYGTGTYSSGTYSSPGTGVSYLRTWSICDYGANVICCPRGGAIYEWAPLATTSPTELVTNGNFSTQTGWSIGAGWTISAGIATSTLSNAALAQITISPAAASYVDLTFDLTQSAGTLQPSFNSVAVGSAIAASGSYALSAFGSNAGGNLTVAFTGTGFTGTLDNVSIKQKTLAYPMINAPTQNTCILVTPDKFVMAFGTIEANTGLFNPMHIRWSDIAPNSHTWTPTDTNLSRSYTLGIGSRIVAAKITNSEILVWTDKALYAGTYANNSTIVYSWRMVGQNCGLIGANAACVLGGIAYWMSPDGGNFRYSGGAPQPVQSTMRKDVFDHISFVQQDKIFAAPISAYQDVITLYPDQRDGTNEVSRYALCCTQEPAPLMGAPGAPSLGVWAPGSFTRTAWCDAGIFQYPIAVNSDGSIYYQEKGTTANGSNIQWTLETGAYQLGSGETLYLVDNFIPDFKALSGGCSYTPTSWKFPQSTPITHGPFMILSATEKVSLISDPPLGRQIAHLFEGNSSPAEMRGGKHQMEIQDTGMTN